MWERKTRAIVNGAIEERNKARPVEDSMTWKYGITFAAGAVIAVLAAFVILASLDDGSDYSPYGPDAGAPKSASSQ